MNAWEMPASKLSIWESREKSRESRTRKETRVRGARKKGPLPLTRLRRSLARSLAKTCFCLPAERREPTTNRKQAYKGQNISYLSSAEPNEHRQKFDGTMLNRQRAANLQNVD